MWTFLYRGLWTAARSVAPLAALRNGKTSRAVRGRLHGAARLVNWAAHHRDTDRPLVWFHAASVGEGRQAEAVLVRLRSAKPGWQIIYTHSSPSAERLAASLPADFAGYLPADTIGDTAAALDAARPSAIIFSTTDLWPELVRQAAARRVGLGLVSATLAEGSSRRGPLARRLMGEAWAALDAVGAIDEQDATRLIALGVRPERMQVTGDARHDSAAARVRAIDPGLPALRVIREAAGNLPLVLAGSTWPPDEALLLPALGLVRSRHSLGAVIAPHEPDPSHLARLERQIARHLPGSDVLRLSELERNPTAALPCPIILVDRVGVLADLYALARVAYVGGGHHRGGLHSVIEPAALGAPVLFGPRWRGSRDARLLLDAGGAVVTRDEDALAAALELFVENDKAHEKAGAAARAVVDKGLGAARRSVELVLALVEQHRR